jgi:hypothetical protein
VLAKRNSLSLTTQIFPDTLHIRVGKRFFGTKNPHAMLFSERSGSPQGTERDFLSSALDFQHISRDQSEFIAEGFGKDDAPGLIQGECRVHKWHYELGNAICKWHFKTSP